MARLSDSWPRPGRVTLEWHPDVDAPRRRREAFTYEAFVPAPIAEAELWLPGDVAERVTDAEVVLRDLDRDAAVDLEAIAGPMLRSEGVASSWIEGIQASQRRVAEALFDPRHATTAARQIAANIRVMTGAVAGADVGALSIERVLALHRELMAGTPGVKPGEVRRTQNWIGPHPDSPRDAIYVPPPPGDVERLLDDLVRFAARTDVPAVAHAAILHAQFEGIHAFADGNGRVGRVLVHVLLRRRGAFQRVSPPISTLLLADRAGYYASLADYQQAGDVVGFVAHFADATLRAGHHAFDLAVDLRELRDDWLELADRPRAGSIARRLVDALASMPVLNTQTVAEHFDVDTRVALRGITRLEDGGVLKQVSYGRRNRVWVAPRLFTLLDDFQVRATEGPDDV